MRCAVITRYAGTDGALALPSKFESTVCELYNNNRVRGSRVKGGTTLRDADCGALTAGFGLEPTMCRTAEAEAGPSIDHS